MKEWKNRLKAEPVTAYVPPERKEHWEQMAIEMGFVRNTKDGVSPNLSEFVQTMVESSLNEFRPPERVGGPVEDQLRAKIHSLESEIEALRRQNEELKRREIGVSEDRIIDKLSTDKTKSFDLLVQELIDTEAEAAYETLQRLLRKNVVEYVPASNTYRLKR